MRTLCGRRWSGQAAAWLFAAILPHAVLAEPPRPPSDVIVADAPNDTGKAIDISWALSPDDVTGSMAVTGYEVLRSESADGEFASVGTPPKGLTKYRDSNCKRGVEYWYQVVARGEGSARSEPAPSTTPVAPVMQWFDWDKLALLVIMSLLIFGISFFMRRAKLGAPVRLRKIAGLEAAEEAVGRATEMGRSILFVIGLQDVNDIQTIAGLTVLSRIARLAAEHGAELEVPTCRSLVMTAARETVKEAFLAAGRPDAYNEDNIYYVTDEQFGFVAAVAGQMVREKPAACFYMGAFFAESLILAETGNHVGAIQVAGTAMPAQLPFFVAAADYTLIGEEFFAASAYLSGEPTQLGSLQGQDVGKFVAIVLIVVGCGAAAIAGMAKVGGFAAVATWLVEALT
ncbi:MAG: fibronectin type III domain-containing protein [Planctomycetes bacterium]|nr:fibronectin type III domain-containing protein [Planctomycetota bacterium]